MRNFRNISSFSLLALLIAAIGCGEKRVAVVPVTGKVTVGNEVPVGAQVVLHPVSGGHENVVATGTVKPDGTFQISTYEPGDGAPPGDYVATIEWFKVVEEGGGGGRGPNVLPKQYAAKDQSPVKVTVTQSPTEIPPIVIR